MPQNSVQNNQKKLQPRHNIGLAVAVLLMIIAPPQSHAGHEGPGISQGDIGRSISVTQEPGNAVRWIFPGPRRLDPALFGTPQNPFGAEPDIGVPLTDRIVSRDGRSFTTTISPTAFSDFFASVGGGLQARMTDLSATDNAASQDNAQAEFFFTSPDGSHQYNVILTRILPVGHAHPFFGGVLINGVLHGRTGFGTRLQPTSNVIGAFWGMAQFYVDGFMVADNRMVHFMTTERVRSPDHDRYRLLFDNELHLANGVHTHLLLPDMIVTPQGGMQKQPLPTNFRLPNGREQPFIHLMFETATVRDIVRSGP